MCIMSRSRGDTKKTGTTAKKSHMHGTTPTRPSARSLQQSGSSAALTLFESPPTIPSPSINTGTRSATLSPMVTSPTFSASPHQPHTIFQQATRPSTSGPPTRFESQHVTSFTDRCSRTLTSRTDYAGRANASATTSATPSTPPINTLSPCRATTCHTLRAWTTSARPRHTRPL